MSKECTCDDLVNNGDHYCPIHGTFAGGNTPEREPQACTYKGCPVPDMPESVVHKYNCYYRLELGNHPFQPPAANTASSEARRQDQSNRAWPCIQCAKKNNPDCNHAYHFEIAPVATPEAVGPQHKVRRWIGQHTPEYGPDGECVWIDPDTKEICALLKGYDQNYLTAGPQSVQEPRNEDMENLGDEMDRLILHLDGIDCTCTPPRDVEEMGYGPCDSCMSKAIADYLKKEIALASYSKQSQPPTCLSAMKHFEGCKKCSESYLEEGAAMELRRLQSQPSFECLSPKAGANSPHNCGWPFCGCDQKAHGESQPQPGAGQRLKEIADRCAKATEGPWTLCFHLQSAEKDASCSCGYRGSIWSGDGEQIICEMGVTPEFDGESMVKMIAEPAREESLNNAALISHARTDIPYLLGLLVARDSSDGAERERKFVFDDFCFFCQTEKDCAIQGKCLKPPTPTPHTSGETDHLPDSTKMVGNEGKLRAHTSAPEGNGK